MEIILYKLRNVIEKAGRGEDIYPHWKTNLNGVKNNNYKFRLHPRLVTAILNRVNDMDITDVNNVYNIEGYTRLTTISQDGNRVIYHANPHIQDCGHCRPCRQRPACPRGRCHRSLHPLPLRQQSWWACQLIVILNRCILSGVDQY